MPKKRVVIDTFHLLNALTGIRSYTVELCKGLEQYSSPDFEFVLLPNWRQLNNSTILKGRMGILGKILNHLFYFFWKQIVLPFYILIKRVDVIIAPDYLLPTIKFGARSIAVFHDTFYWEMRKNYNPLWRWYFVNSVILGLNSRSKIIAVSAYSKARIQSIIEPKQPVEVAYLSPPKIDQSLNNPSLLLNLDIDSGCDYFLHVGVFDRRKNIELLISAFSSFCSKPGRENFKLVLVGSRAVTNFHDSFGSVKELISALGLEGRVLLPGFVSKGLLSTLYHNAFAYVFPSLEEGFGIPTLEAMNSGVPVIVSDQPALVEVSGDAALVFERTSVEQLVDRMESLLNKQVRERLIRKGYLRGASFSRENFINQMIKHL